MDHLRTVSLDLYSGVVGGVVNHYSDYYFFGLGLGQSVPAAARLTDWSSESEQNVAASAAVVALASAAALASVAALSRAVPSPRSGAARFKRTATPERQEEKADDRTEGEQKPRGLPR